MLILNMSSNRLLMSTMGTLISSFFDVWDALMFLVLWWPGCWEAARFVGLANFCSSSCT